MSTTAELKAKLSLNDSAFVAGIQRANQHAKSFERNLSTTFAGTGRSLLAGAGALTGLFSAGAFTRGIEDSIKLGSGLHDLSKTTGIAVGQLAQLRGVFLDSDKSSEDMGSALTKMNKFLFNSKDAGGAAADVFNRLGLSIGDIAKLGPAQQFQQFAEAILKLPDPASRAATAMQIFGKTGASLMPVFEDIAKIDLSKLSAMARVMELNATKFDELGDSIGRAKRKKDEFFAGLTSELLGGLTKGSNKVEGLDAVGGGQAAGKWIANFAKEFQPMIDSTGKEIEGIKEGIGKLFGFHKQKEVVPPLSEIPDVDVTAGDPWAKFRAFKSFKEPPSAFTPGRTENFLERFHPEPGGNLPPLGSLGAAYGHVALGDVGSRSHPDAYANHPDAYGQTAHPAEKSAGKPLTKEDLADVMEKYLGGN